MGALSAIGGGLLGSGLNAVFGNKTAKRQEQAYTNAANQSDALQRDMFQKGLELTQPYRDAGVSALPALNEAAMAGASPFSFDANAYFNSPEYAALAQQAEAGILRNASATGGLRSGNAQAALGAIAPQLMQQGRQNAMSEYSINQGAMMDRYNRLQGFAGLGLGTAQQASSQAGALGSNLAQNAMIRGGAQADRYGNQYKLFKGLTTDILGGF